MVKLSGLNSVWLAEGAVDFLRDFMDLENEDDQIKGSPTPAQVRKGFEAIQTRMMLELQHHLAKNADGMWRYSQELQRFKTTKSIQDSLGAVFQLFAEMSQNTMASALLSLSGLSSIDTGMDIGPWVEKMQNALNALTKALNEDLNSKR